MIYDILLPQERYLEALDVALKAALANPNYGPRIEEVLNHIRWSESSSSSSIPPQFEEFKTQYKHRYGRDFQFLDRETISLSWALYDLDQIVHLLQEREIAFVLTNYPPPITTPMLSINQAIRQYAQSRNYPFIDTTANLEDFFLKGAVKKDYYAFNGQDNHLNEKGYQLLAQELVAYILEHFDF